jgi:hypothetical protein
MITCASRVPLALSFTAGLAVCASLVVLLDQPGRDAAAPAVAAFEQPLGAMPRSREHTAVLSWIFEHRSDAAMLEFLSWSPARPVADNPITKRPATLVQLIVKSRNATEEKVEYLSFYLENLEVLGSISKPYPDVRTAVCA